MSTIPRITQYRPFLPLTLSINYWLHEYQLPGYHLVNLLIQIIAGILVYFLCFELLNHWVRNEYTEKKQRNIAFISSLLFTIHPVSGILVNYICSRDLLLMQMFLMGSLLVYVRMRRLGMNLLRWAIAILLFSCSMLSKTNGVVFPFIILLFEFTLAKRKINDLKVWKSVIPFVAVVFAYFAFTGFYLGFSDIKQVTKIDSSPWTYSLTQARIHLSHYFFNFFWPWFIRQAPYVKAVDNIFDIGVLAGIIFIFTTVIVAYKIRKENPLLTFCIIAYWILLSPTSSFLPLHHLAVHYRPYPASPFFFLAVVFTMTTQLREKTLKVFLILLLLYFGAASWWQNATWKTENLLWSHSVRVGGEALAHLNLAMSFDDKKDPRVREHLEYALRMNPNYVLANIDLGLLLIDLGEKTEGLNLCKRAVALRSDRAQSHFWLSRAYTKLGMVVEASESSARAAKLQPRSLQCLYQAALDVQEIKDYKKSLIYLDACEKIQPGYKEVYFVKGFALQKTGNLNEAIKYYKMYLAIDPNHIQTYFNLAYALMDKGNYRKAIEYFNKTLLLNPNYREVHLHLANCYGKIGNLEEQAKQLKHYNLKI